MSPTYTSRRVLALMIGAVAFMLALIGRPSEAVPPPGALTSRPRPEALAVKPLAPGAEVRTQAGERRRVALADGSVLYVNENTLAKLSGPHTLAVDRGEIYVEVVAATDNQKPFIVEAAGTAVAGRSASFAVRVEKQGPAIGVTRGQVAVRGHMEPLHAGQQLEAGAAKPTATPRASHTLAWLRDAMCAAEAPLIPANDHAGGALIAIDPHGQEAKLTLRRFHVDVHIEDGFARTTIDQTYFNHHNEQLEGTFYFPLPPDASLSRLAMYVNGQLMEGGMAEREHARNVYETIRYARRDPALLEWVDGSTFKMRVFPLEPRQEKRIILSYSQRVPALYGKLSYRFPAGHSLQKVRDWSAEVRIKDGAGWIWDSPSHSLKAREEKKDLLLFGSVKDTATNRDIVLNVADPRHSDPSEEVVQYATAEHEGARYLMARFRPALGGKLTSHRRDWVFLVETSGDRDPLLARVQIEVLRNLLAYAEPDDTFTVLAAGTRVTAFNKEPLPLTPANVNAALAFLETAHLIGALDLGEALTEAAKCLKVDAPHLVHLGSGIAAMGERRDDVLAKRLPAGSTYIGIGVGRRWNRALMKTAAERTGGHFTQINPDEPIAWRSFELMATINTPRLMDVEIRDADGKASFLAFNQAIAQGEEIVALTRVTGTDDLPKRIVVKATLEGRAFERIIPVNNATPKAGYLPRTWAKLEIDRLLADDPVKHREAIIALSKAMYVITPYTSLLVLENEDQYVQYRVDRGRKDHWALYPLAEKIPVIVEPDPDALDAAQAKGRRPVKTVLQTLVDRAHEGDKKMHKNGDRQVLALGRKGTSLFFEGDGKLDMLAREVNGRDPELLAVDFSASLSAVAGDQPIRHGVLEIPRGAKRINELSLFDDSRSIEMASAWSLATGERLPPEATRPMSNLGHPDLPSPGGVFGFAIEQSRAVGGGMPKGATFYGRSGVTRTHARLGPRQPLSRFAMRSDVAAPPRDLAPMPADPFLRALAQVQRMPSRGPIHERPSYAPPAEVFHDLVAYAPGLDTSTADVLGVIDAEALPGAWNKPGKIDPAARTLLERARVAGWQSLTMPAENGQSGYTILFDGAGRFAYDTTLPSGLRERAVCDGTTLTQVYPQLALAARRDVTRFHRADLATLVPWYLPPAEELARGADLTVAGARTVAIVPHGVASLPKDATYHVVHLVFGEDGRLTQRRVVKMPGGEVAYRLTLSPDGVAALTDGKGKELAVQKCKLAPATAPALTMDTKEIVVLPLPYRTADHVRRTLKVEKKSDAELTLKEALPVFAAYVAEGNGNAAQQLFRQVFHAREQRQLGFYVLLASCGVNLDSDHGNVLAEHLDHPLAQYLALHTSPVLRQHASQWAVGSGSWQDDFLQHLAVTHALLQRWENAKVLKGDAVRVDAEKRRAIDYVKKNHDSVFGWALLCRIQDRAEKDAVLHGQLAELWPLFEEQADLRYAARYEHARSLWRAGKKDDARQRFRALYEAAIKDGMLPAIDGDFRNALLAGDVWGTVLRQTARQLVEQKRRMAVLAMARQCWDLDDQPLAGQLLATALDGIADADERSALAVAAFLFMRETGQLPEADRLLQTLLADARLARRSVLWRLGHELAQQRDMPARAIECLEKALALEAEHPPEVIDLEATRKDYGALLAHYQGLADAMVALKLATPPDFLSRVIRAADRWRAVDNDPAAACKAAANVLKRLGDRALAWDYLTTPVGLRPNESGPWWGLAATLGKQGDLELADRAYRAAAEAEPTDPQILWDRAQNLKQMGKQQDAHQLVTRIAAGTWQPRFQGLQAQARHLLKGE
jgi:ferric-dicitrate binding protein FerR (iron transport regulator)